MCSATRPWPVSCATASTSTTHRATGAAPSGVALVLRGQGQREQRRRGRGAAAKPLRPSIQQARNGHRSLELVVMQLETPLETGGRGRDRRQSRRPRHPQSRRGPPATRTSCSGSFRSSPLTRPRPTADRHQGRDEVSAACRRRPNSGSAEGCQRSSSPWARGAPWRPTGSGTQSGAGFPGRRWTRPPRRSVQAGARALGAGRGPDPATGGSLRRFPRRHAGRPWHRKRKEIDQLAGSAE